MHSKHKGITCLHQFEFYLNEIAVFEFKNAADVKGNRLKKKISIMPHWTSIKYFEEFLSI